MDDFTGDPTDASGRWRQKAAENAFRVTPMETVTPPPDGPAVAGPPRLGTVGRLLGSLGPGLISGAADDDPSGIATYAQAGAAFGYGLAWTMLLSLPLIAGIQEICGRIGRVTGAGLAANIKRRYPRSLVRIVVLLLFVANAINLGADLGAMGSAMQLLTGGRPHAFVLGFAIVSTALAVWVPYARYVRILKWGTLTLLAYALTAIVIDVPWITVLRGLIVPSLEPGSAYLTTVVAVFGTTISPYLFFWQSSQEAEDAREGAVHGTPADALTRPRELRRIRADTWLGMVFSNLIGLLIIVTTAATLNVSGVTQIETAAQAAEALRPLAGEFAFALFALGVIGTGLLAVPVLAGSAAYAVSEAFDWPIGLSRRLGEASGFYGALAAATLIGVALHFSPIDPIKALFWSAVINGVVSVPLIAIVVLLASDSGAMRGASIPTGLRLLGWTTFTVMLLLVTGAAVSWL